jgi:hypothetical protein
VNIEYELFFESRKRENVKNLCDPRPGATLDDLAFKVAAFQAKQAWCKVFPGYRISAGRII